MVTTTPEKLNQVIMIGFLRPRKNAADKERIAVNKNFFINRLNVQKAYVNVVRK
jgi:hypothetical protein